MFKRTKAFSSFSVDDLSKAKAFYNLVLGLEVIDDPMGVIELDIEAGSRVMVYPKPDHTPATFTVLNFLVDNIDEAVDKLTALGVQFEQYPDPITTNEKGICRTSEGPSIAWFKDPAGNIFSIIEEK